MKIAVFHGGNIFISPIVADWIKKGHDVKVSPNVNYYPNWEPELIFFEFCTSNIVFYSRKMEHQCPVICRIHGVGIRLNLYKNVDWSKVDDVIFISNWLWNQADKKRFDSTRVHIVNNGVDLNKFTLKKDFTPTYKLAYVGRKNTGKGYNDLLPAYVKKFKEIDSRYELHEANGEIPHSEMNNWLEDKDYLIHPSYYETFSFAVAESMAKGIRPIINHWPGAEETWGNEFFFENFNLIQEPEKLRQIIKEKYNIETTIKKINNICKIRN